ncbi:hypothetical protein [uncultured Desulfovibrio sp.]|uniref:hypothetical protein n=1 Tax=uncultured Desulfovibrio sp. TaxID=167968 RepID=UPI0026381E9B|nr:hypothetical protein [uncultured Desulfovibrio sp.]
MRRKLPRCFLLPVALLVFCRLLLTDPGPVAGAVVFTPRISSLPTIGPSPRIHVQLDVPPDDSLSPEGREADLLRRRARLWLMGLQAGADSLARNRAAARYFIGAEPRLILSAMLYGATGPDEREGEHIDFILEPGPFRQALERALRPGPLYGAWQSLLDELRTVLARTPGPDSPEEARQVAWLRALLGPARRALAAAGDGWLATADQALALEHAATRVEESPLLWLLLAEATLQRDQPQRCVGACGRALALDPRLARARYIRALGYWRLHQLALAENDLSIILHDAPHASMTPWLRARGAIRKLRGNTTGMCEDFIAACVRGGDCDGLEMARRQDLCRDEQPSVAAGAPPVPSPEEETGAETRRQAEYLGSLAQAFVGTREVPSPLDSRTATDLGFLPPDSTQTPFCPRSPSRALGLLAARTLPEGSLLDGHDLPLVDEEPHWLEARRRGMDWGEDVLLLLGVDLRLSRLPEEELRDRAQERALLELGLAPLRAGAEQCPRRLWTVPAQWTVSVSLPDAVLTELWAVIDATQAVAARSERLRTPSAPPAAPSSAVAGLLPPEVEDEFRGMTPRRTDCPLPRRAESLVATWARIWDDAWAVRIKTLAYALRDEEALSGEGQTADRRLVGPPPPPRLQEGARGYPARWDWIVWPAQEERRGGPPAEHRSLRGSCL